MLLKSVINPIFWSHQVRKTYLNTQFNANLLALDEEGAIIVAEMLVYTKTNHHELEIKAFDHWSSDTVQDAFFTASCFETVNWKSWYDVEIRSWTFLEAGEAKTTLLFLDFSCNQTIC
jgi:hypothetical protein